MTYKSTIFLFAMATLAAFDTARASVVFSDNFDSYTQNPLVGQGTWAEITNSGSALPINVTADPLNSSNQVAALGGSTISPSYSGEDLYNAFATAINYTTGGSLELDFKLNVEIAQASGGAYFLTFGNVATAGNTNFFGRIFAEDDGKGGYLLGLSATSRYLAPTARPASHSILPTTCRSSGISSVARGSIRFPSM
ncbi:MAG: hypothetical protein QM796_20160 [Chthoniobacteraceae bacterium]